jgi:Domain of unknown function (DUF6457)
MWGLPFVACEARIMPGRIESRGLMNAREWIEAYAERVGTEPPSAEQWSALLDLAGVAAHSSERVAAPVSCWVAAKAGVEPAQALQAAREIVPDA